MKERNVKFKSQKFHISITYQRVGLTISRSAQGLNVLSNKLHKGEQLRGGAEGNNLLNNKIKGEGRKMVLLIDNFLEHELAVRLVGGEQGLSHVRIARLPLNTISK